MATKTYYEVLRYSDDMPTAAQARKLGTSGYGYATLKMAVRNCPKGYYVRERFIDGNNDWAGRIVYLDDLPF